MERWEECIERRQERGGETGEGETEEGESHMPACLTSNRKLSQGREEETEEEGRCSMFFIEQHGPECCQTPPHPRTPEGRRRVKESGRRLEYRSRRG